VNTLPEIERAISQLSVQDLAKFRRWFAEFDADAWDRQIEADVAAGRLDFLIMDALKRKTNSSS
jgi:hypothetical protein